MYLSVQELSGHYISDGCSEIINENIRWFDEGTDDKWKRGRSWEMRNRVKNKLRNNQLRQFLLRQEFIIQGLVGMKIEKIQTLLDYSYTMGNEDDPKYIYHPFKVKFFCVSSTKQISNQRKFIFWCADNFNGELMPVMDKECILAYWGLTSENESRRIYYVFEKFTLDEYLKIQPNYQFDHLICKNSFKKRIQGFYPEKLDLEILE